MRSARAGAFCRADEAAHAQTYPSRTIKLIVPFGPGGPTDLAARLVSQIVQSALGQSVVIENRPGAAAPPNQAAANADPDGYTLLIGTSATLGVVPALVKNPGYDPIASFAAVAKVADSSLVLCSSGASGPVGCGPHRLRKGPSGRLSYASAGAGNQTQLLAELFKSQAGWTSSMYPTRAARDGDCRHGRAGAHGVPGHLHSSRPHPGRKAQGAGGDQRGAPPAAARRSHMVESELPISS